VGIRVVGIIRYYKESNLGKYNIGGGPIIIILSISRREYRRDRRIPILTARSAYRY